MIAPDYGFKVDSFIGTYKIVELEGVEYIVSNEFYPALEGEKELERKSLFVEDFKKNDYLLLALANVNIENEEEIIEYCNKYGLIFSEFSKSMCNDDVIEDVNSDVDSVYRHDMMSKSDFCRCVVNIKNLMNLKEKVNKNIYNEDTARLLIYFILFSNIWKHDVNNDKIKTTTGKIRHKLQNDFYDEYNLKKMILSNSFKKTPLVYFESCLQKYDLERELHLKREYANNSYVFDICKFLFYEFFEKNSINHIYIDSSFDVLFSNDIIITSDMINLMKKIALKVLSDTITEGLSNVRPYLLIDDNGEFYADWGFTQQYEGIYMQFFLMCSSIDLQVRKCQNSTCEKFFTANFRGDKKYCCHECAVTAAKRRQRVRDKENPNRPRLKPGFQSKKAKK